MPQCDLMFSVNDFECIQQAIIAFDQPVEAQWPLDDLNGALSDFYRSTLNLPWISVVNDLKGPVGYIITGRNDRRDRDELEEMFWTCLAEGNLAHAGTKEFLVDMPRWNATPHNPDAGREPVAAVGYVAPYGPALPVGPVNDGIRLLMGQQNWPSSGAIYLYPVHKQADPHFSGLWLADSVDGIGDDSDVDDSIFKSIREQNLRKGIPPTFQRKRYDW